MIQICELLTDEPEGGSALIPLTMVLSLYGYLARLNCAVGENPEELKENPATIYQSSTTLYSGEHNETLEDGIASYNTYQVDIMVIKINDFVDKIIFSLMLI